MRHFETPDGDIRAIDEGQEPLIDRDWIELSRAEVTQRVSPPPTLDDLKQRKLREIEGARDQDIAAGLVHDGIPVQTRPRDQINVIALVLAAQVKKGAGDASLMKFRDAENVTHDLTPDQMIAMGMAAMGYAESKYQRAWSLKDQARTVTTDAELDTIIW